MRVISADELLRTRLCTSYGCGNDAEGDGDLCRECRARQDWLDEPPGPWFSFDRITPRPKQVEAKQSEPEPQFKKGQRKRTFRTLDEFRAALNDRLAG